MEQALQDRLVINMGTVSHFGKRFGNSPIKCKQTHTATLIRQDDDTYLFEVWNKRGAKKLFSTSLKNREDAQKVYDEHFFVLTENQIIKIKYQDDVEVVRVGKIGLIIPLYRTCGGEPYMLTAPLQK